MEESVCVYVCVTECQATDYSTHIQGIDPSLRLAIVSEPGTVTGLVNLIEPSDQPVSTQVLTARYPVARFLS